MSNTALNYEHFYAYYDIFFKFYLAAIFYELYVLKDSLGISDVKLEKKCVKKYEKCAKSIKYFYFPKGIQVYVDSFHNIVAAFPDKVYEFREQNINKFRNIFENWHFEFDFSASKTNLTKTKKNSNFYTDFINNVKFLVKELNKPRNKFKSKKILERHCFHLLHRDNDDEPWVYWDNSHIL